MPFSQSYSLTDQGLQRDNNEDSYLSLPERGLWAVADGMGGHEAGEVASEIVVETLETETANGETLAEAISRSHHAVLQAARQGRGADGMGSTVVALSSENGSYRVCWVGDSRAYLWIPSADGGKLQQLTTDHSYVQMLLESGAIEPEDLENHPDRHIITQCIGSAELAEVQVDVIEGEWHSDACILLCSDGLSDELEDSEIARILCDASSVESAAKTLLDSALQRGGRDNITLQLVQSPGSKAPEVHTRWPAAIPRVTGNPWLDSGLYGLALLSALLILVWTLR